ncbi:BTAD domain-containing putative transcriptional regulator [Longispora sp. K20-0274]|uniref:AfsR/SARP family transcriptional regulator n=1 Tax=Longispora sp. K20-0274 TaxID=3088255 RepID=UPI003999FA70
MTAQFGLLGPIEVRTAGRLVALSAPRHRAVLAFLLLNARRIVSPERLIDAIWGAAPPERARGQIQVAVSALRRALRDVGADHLLETRPSGYVLEVAPERLDLDLFTASLASPDADSAALRAGLALWRGPALADVAAPYVEANRTRLEEQRLTVVERLVARELDAGRHAEVVEELVGWAAESPARESLHRHLMLALFRLGRQPDALAVARDFRRTLAEEYGLDPGAEFVELEKAILVDDPSLRVPAARPAPRRAVPAQLPPDVPDFVGRAEEFERLDDLLASAGAVVITTIEGVGGVGKTALALRWAHRVRDLYPDGQLYVNLHGYSTTEPVRPIDAINGFLRALGVPGEDIPVDLDDAAAAYRTLLADRRALVVLDNANGPDQVRPLLPGSRGSRVVVTSRDRLAGLVARDGARLMELGVLTPGEGVELLTRILGRSRVGDEPGAVGELVRLCGLLPLALRIAAAHLISEPGRRIADYNAELLAGDLLASLEVDGDDLASVRGVFGQSYRRLADEPARLFRLVGVLPGVDVTAESAAALLDTTTARAAAVLEELAAAHLLESRGVGRYEPHDLIRAYARQLAATEDGPDGWRAPLRRLLDGYVVAGDAAARLLYPHKLWLEAPAPEPDRFPDAGGALAWLEAEWANLVAATRHAAQHDPRPAVWILAGALRGYCHLGYLTGDWLLVAGAGLTAARAVADPLGTATCELSLGLAYRVVGDVDAAIAHFDRARADARTADWPVGEAAVESSLGTVHWVAGRLEPAVEHMTRALEIGERIGSLSTQANNLGNLGNVYGDLGRLAEAADHHRRALALYREMGAEGAQALALHNLGGIQTALGRFEEALESVSAAVELFRALGDHYENVALVELSRACRGLGRLEDAERHAGAALASAQGADDTRLETEAFNELGSVATGQGRIADALWAHGEARARAGAVPLEDLRAMIGLVDAHVAGGDLDQARQLAEQARDLAEQRDFVQLRCEAYTRLAELRSLAGDRAGAAGHAALAMDIRERTGYRMGEERTRAALAAAGRAV